MKKGYMVHLEKDAMSNTDFRRVLYTGAHMQLVLMSLLPQESIGLETHHDNDQFFRFEAGEGKVTIDEMEYVVTSGDTIIIPAGARHNITNTSNDADLKMYTIYAPAHHKDGIVRATKADAAAQDAPFDGMTSE